MDGTAEREVDVACYGQPDAIVGHVDRRRFQHAHIADLLAEIAPVEHIEDAVLAAGQQQVASGRQHWRGRPEILVPIVVVRRGAPVAVAERNEPVVERERGAVRTFLISEADNGFGKIRGAVEILDPVRVQVDIAAVRRDCVDMAALVRRGPLRSLPQAAPETGGS